MGMNRNRHSNSLIAFENNKFNFFSPGGSNRLKWFLTVLNESVPMAEHIIKKGDFIKQ